MAAWIVAPFFSSAPSMPTVFLHMSVLDVDQLWRIMRLVGTPEPQLLKKISSESVSVKCRFSNLCCTAPSWLGLICLCRPTESASLLCIITTISKLHLFLNLL